MNDKFIYEIGDLVKFNIKAFNSKDELIEKLSGQNIELVLNNEDTKYSSLFIGQDLKQSFISQKQFEKNEELGITEEDHIVFQIDVLDYEKAELAKLKADNLKLKNDLLIKDITIRNISASLSHSEEQLRLALEDVKKAKEAQVVERLTLPKEELEKIKLYAMQKFFDDFLTPYSTLKMAFDAASNSDNPEVKNYTLGFNMVLNMVENVLNDYGIVEFVPQLNSEFDPETSKIIEQIVDDSQKANTIIKVKQNGYKLHERVLKPALVIATKHSEKTNDKNHKKNKKHKK
ncbi:nucleotide exchange factor GrpE [Mycoplasmopsis iners]|uniref:nucleotide exchange factor GrpE n=1 Tax=Mycoplasmopsis iners TaxID=76630 RepID=UPI000690805A|nr:nucleotide exchange factor GrpE [Mycoplasmopsis iners]